MDSRRYSTHLERGEIMAKSQASRRKEKGEAKKKEIIELLISLGKTHTKDGREISGISFVELDDIYKLGVRA